MNRGIPAEFFEKYLDKLDWYEISRNEGIPFEFFEKHLINLEGALYGKRAYKGVFKNSRIPIWFFEKYYMLDEYVEQVGAWYLLSRNEGIPLWFFEKHIKTVDWKGLSSNMNFVKQLKMKELHCLLRPCSLRGARAE